MIRRSIVPWNHLPARRVPRLGAAIVLTTVLLWGSDVPAAVLQASTIKAWDRYYQWANARVDRELSDPSRFLNMDFLPAGEKAELQRRLAAGEVVIKRLSGIVPPGTEFQVPEAEIHHWWGCILVPGIKLDELMKFLQDYDHHAGKFADVEKSKLLLRDGDLFRFFFRLNRTKAFVTVHYHTEQECVYKSQGPGRVSSRSIATKIAELDNPGTPKEQEKPPGNDRGFLWRLVSWWRFQQTEKGVIVECESASLSRDIPLIVKLIPGVAAYIRSTPKESLESVLASIRLHAKP